jgi:succinate-semialdehyde dehydrogenase/glutarate-semialdehyde dehydrogenase
MSQLYSTNPVTGKTTHSFDELTDKEVAKALDRSQDAYARWRCTTFDHRIKLMLEFAHILRQKREYLSHLITEEIGTPVDQANSEIEKSAYIAEYFADNTKEFLKSREVSGVASQARIVFDPLGVVLHVAPWNYPFYLALRPVITALLAGNTVLLKHASNVPRISTVLDSLFKEAGFGNAYQSLLIGSSKVEQIIRHPAVAMVTVIGSERAGSSVASIAGQEIKKSVMELGGSDPFMVMGDANIDEAVKAATYSRLRNCGQSCNAAKRFIVMDSVYDEFVEKLKQSFENFTVGDPMDTSVDMGPMATQKARDEVHQLVVDALAHGAHAVVGGTIEEGEGYYYKPTLLTNVTPEMSVFSQEVFGPVAPVLSVSSEEEMITLANLSPYGLGASIWTKDIEHALTLAHAIDSGNVYINRMVRSDPRLPFGGVKKSGYGREFSDFGLIEFTNIKSIVVN